MRSTLPTFSHSSHLSCQLFSSRPRFSHLSQLFSALNFPDCNSFRLFSTPSICFELLFSTCVNSCLLFSSPFSPLHKSFHPFAATLLTDRVNSCHLSLNSASQVFSPFIPTLLTYSQLSSPLPNVMCNWFYSTRCLFFEAGHQRTTRAAAAPRSAASPARFADSELQSTKELRMRLQHQETLLQPLPCDLQTLACQSHALARLVSTTTTTNPDETVPMYKVAQYLPNTKAKHQQHRNKSRLETSVSLQTEFRAGLQR